MPAPARAVNPMPGAVLLALLQCLSATASAEAIPEQAVLDAEYAHHVRPLLDTYCVRCHDGAKRSGGVRLDDLAGTFTPENSPTWADAKDMLDVGSMPPKRAEQLPTREEQDLLVTWIGDATRRYEADHRENRGDTLVRRINLRAYANMMRTLLDVPAQCLADFPEDTATDGFDTVGAGLYATGYLYDLYWKCAQRTLDLALPTAAAPPRVQEFEKPFKSPGHHKSPGTIDAEEQLKRFEGDPKSFVLKNASDLTPFIRRTIAVHYHLHNVGEVEAKGIDWRLDPACAAEVEAYLKQFVEKANRQDASVSEHQFLCQGMYFAVSDPGWYAIAVRSACVTDQRLAAPAQIKVYRVGSTVPVFVDGFMVTAAMSSPADHEARAWLDKGQYTVSVQNALQTCEGFVTHRHEWAWLAAVHGVPYAECYDSWVFDSDPPTEAAVRDRMFPLRGTALEVRGPTFDAWPPPAVARIFTRGLQEPPSRAYAEEIATAFMKRACACDCDAAMAKPYVDLIMSSYQARHDFVAAVKVGLASILCSPRFLYLCEDQRPDPAQRKPLGVYELARRLAYFLWSDLPDEALLASAASGALLRDDELLAQARRMLKDPRSRALREGFTTQWLKIDKIEHIAFDQDLLPTYDPILAASARAESVAFFSELLDHDLSILDFIDSDFVMLDGRMALHYGIPGVVGDEFRRVPLPPGSHRGGVLGQASVLMATSNGMVSSVVRRGAFIMRQLLGVSPGSPPKNVPALDKQPLAKADGSPFTQRERLAMHRADASCARCHDKIDPLGVGLENYNAIGAFSGSVRLLVTPRSGKPEWKEVPADVHGQLLDGAAYDGPDELKQRLLEHRDQFVRCFAGQLAVYALGRPLQLSDGPVLERLCARLPEQQYGLSSLVEQLVLSELFRNK